jgi:uncharacterized repeat protein (TIGR04052 family)
MSWNLRSNRVVRQAALALACSALFACSDSEDSTPQDAGTRDAEAPKAGKGGAGGQSAQASQDGQEAVTIRFRATVADRDFSCLERYEDVGSSKATVVPADFRFYVQDLKLITADGEEVEVALDAREPWQTADVALIDFEDMQGRCHGTPETNTTITGKVPAGDYTGVVFTNGVPEELNHLDQSTQSAPLDITDLYWAWLTGYRFMVAELAQDGERAPDIAPEDDAGVAQPGIGLMHIGSTSCRKDRGCTKKNRSVVRLPDFDPSSDVIVADIGAIFSDSDVAQDMQCHAADEICAPMFERLGVDFASGESLATQEVFRVGGAGR